MFDTRFIGFEPGTNNLELAGASILVDLKDFDGVQLAVDSLAADLHKVTGSKSAIFNDVASLNWEDSSNVLSRDIMIVVGSLEKSQFIRELVDTGNLCVQSIQGKWESFQTNVLACPWPSTKHMLVISGSDKRGTIFGIYTLAEQIGVSPWYWWADVPISPHKHIYALPIQTAQGEPSVQYRGIFINDETPGLIDWAHEKFGPKLNSEFYKTVFELLLRMKANFIWPAMWSGFPEPGSIFFEDDPLNQELAHRYGIVVSTSHHEPMQRNMSEWRMSNKGKWVWEENKERIVDFMRAGAERAHPYESILTLGMRGESDGAIQSQDPRAILTDVVATQRDIINDIYGRPDGVGQVMALYKEVQKHYEEGLEVPDDVTLLFADDNFGNIRRLPTSKERHRQGGAGIYYHLEYVLLALFYEKVAKTDKAKIQQQLLAAHASDARKIWLFNVGDIKPLELPLTFALSLAWNIHTPCPVRLFDFFDAYAEREFGLKYAKDIAKLLMSHDRMMSYRRHEHIESNTFSILQYREAESVMAKWRILEERAEEVMRSLPTSHKAAYFQIVQHPIRASRINTELRVTLGRNQLYGLQRRNTTNVLAYRILRLFDDDWSLTEEYNHSPWVDDKWNHIMKQPHYGFSPTTWQAPSRDMITGLSFVQRQQASNFICGQMGIAVEGHTGVRPGLVNEESDRMQPSRGELVSGLTLPELCPYGPKNRFFEIYTRGPKDVDWFAVVEQDWVLLSQYSGHLSPDGEEDQRVEVSIDWNKAPKKFHGIVIINIRSQQADFEQVHVKVICRQVPEGFSGFVESNGSISIDVGMSFSESQQLYQAYPYLGRTSSGAIGLALSSKLPGIDLQPLLYPIYLFSGPSTFRVILYFTMTLEYQPEEQLRYDILLGDSKQTARLLEYHLIADLPVGWEDAVRNNVWTRTHSFCAVSPGAHVIGYRPLARGLLLERIIVDAGGLKDSYFGPPASSFIGNLD
ncbi:uncharacterized protein N7482_010030 [Penicillium canariense]|uniref:Gylcosyl hydrolase 115 C-terminal domain-containing protein n=1 Tax=Penicillium canariense TaxID=189055 RepID=A0A9W9HQY2_9EURO|nr:uncharacterized protein N7482_010030 [Penicillium canariense]KAJ5153552.1 hypothetical protein N7482_010030 [Penicillium canariense]